MKMSRRDLFASIVRQDPAHGWAWPSEVDGRTHVRLVDHEVAVAQQMLRDCGHPDLAELVSASPLATACRLLQWALDHDLKSS